MILYIILGVLAVLLIVVIALMLIAPKSARVERSIVVNAPPDRTFQYLKSLKNFTSWSPWQEKDPEMEQGFRGTDGEVGSVNWWRGNKDVGEGEQEVVRLVPDSEIGMQLRFVKPFKATNDAWLKLSPESDGKTKVSWGFHADFKPPMNIFMMFMNLDKQIGSDYEKGLAVMKQKVETEST